MEMLWQHTHYAARTLFIKPGFTLVVIFTLALGAGANTAIFSVANAAALTPTFAQSATATLSGAVVDEAGAVVAGAKIELTNPGTALKRAATTSGEGYFTFALLPPGTYTLQALLREKKRELAATTGQRRAELERRLLQEYGAYEVKDLPVNVNGLMMLKDEEAQDRLQDEIFDRLYKVYERQDRIYQAASALVPGLGVQSLSMGLAGTDFAHHCHFARAAEGYRQRMMNVLNESITSTDTAKLREFAGTGIRISQAGREVWERVPPFSYTAPSLELVIENCGLSIAALLTWFVFVVVITPAAVSRAKIL